MNVHRIEASVSARIARRAQRSLALCVADGCGLAAESGGELCAFHELQPDADEIALAYHRGELFESGGGFVGQTVDAGWGAHGDQCSPDERFVAPDTGRARRQKVPARAVVAFAEKLWPEHVGMIATADRSSKRRALVLQRPGRGATTILVANSWSALDRKLRRVGRSALSLARARIGATACTGPQRGCPCSYHARRRKSSRDCMRRKRAARLEAERSARVTCPKGVGGHSVCGGLLERTTDKLGRVVTTCPWCDRRARGICRDCSAPVYGRVGYALRCAVHKAIAWDEQKRNFRTAEPEKMREYARRYYHASDARRRARNDYKRRWRKENRDKVKAQKRRANLRGWGQAYQARRRQRLKECAG